MVRLVGSCCETGIVRIVCDVTPVEMKEKCEITCKKTGKSSKML